MTTKSPYFTPTLLSDLTTQRPSASSNSYVDAVVERLPLNRPRESFEFLLRRKSQS
jgi:hypothetical protein